MLEPGYAWKRWLDVLPLAVNLLSFFASVRLFLWVHRLTVAREKLMARQLWHLALADSIESGMLVFWFSLDPLHNIFGIGSEASALLDALCVFGMWNNVAFMTSLLVEVHIALATVAALFRFHNMLRVLSRSVVYLWPPGVVMGVLVAFPSGSFWDTADGACNTSAQAGEEFKSIVMLAALCICFLTYAAGFALVRGSGGLSLQSRIWDRAKFFTLAAMLSWFPFIVYTRVIDKGNSIFGPAGPVAFYITFSLFLSNGFLNALVYALQSRFVSRARKRAAALGARQASQMSQDSRSLNHSNALFHVGFRSVDEIQIVAAQQEEALENAEQETLSLESARKQGGWADAIVARSYLRDRPSGPPPGEQHFSMSFDRQSAWRGVDHSSSTVGSRAMDISLEEEEFLSVFDMDFPMFRSSNHSDTTSVSNGMSSRSISNCEASPRRSDTRSSTAVAFETSSDVELADLSISTE